MNECFDYFIDSIKTALGKNNKNKTHFIYFPFYSIAECMRVHLLVFIIANDHRKLFDLFYVTMRYALNILKYRTQKRVPIFNKFNENTITPMEKSWNICSTSGVDEIGNFASTLIRLIVEKKRGEKGGEVDFKEESPYSILFTKLNVSQWLHLLAKLFN